MRKYIDLIVGQAGAAKAEPTAEEKAVDLSLTEVVCRIRRWEETLERGLLSLEDSAHRIKELRQETGSGFEAQSGITEKVPFGGACFADQN